MNNNKWKVRLGAVAMAASLICSAAPVSVMAAEVPADVPAEVPAGDPIWIDDAVPELPPLQHPVTLSYIVGPDTVSSVTCLTGETIVVEYYYGSLSPEYIFIGWEDLTTGILYTEGQSFVLMQDMQLVAVFAPAAAPQQFMTELPKEEDYGAKEIGNDPSLKESIPAEEPIGNEDDGQLPQGEVNPDGDVPPVPEG